MNAHIFIIAVFLCLLPFYIWTEYHWKEEQFVFTKMACSLLFVAAAVTAYIFLKPDRFYGGMIIAALSFGLAGDLLLVFIEKEKFFFLGLAAFLIGQIIYGITFLSYLGISWIDLAVFLAVAGGSIAMFSIAKFEFGKMKIPVIIYLICIDFMLTMAVSSLYKSGFPGAVRALIVSAAILFFVSDLILSYMQFVPKKHKSFCALNRATYYVAQAVFALSVAFMV